MGRLSAFLNKALSKLKRKGKMVQAFRALSIL